MTPEASRGSLLDLKAIVFDLGNVLVDFDYRIACRRISGFTDKDEDAMFDLFLDSELTRLFEEGKILPRQFFLKVKNMLGLKLGFAEFVSIWNEVFFLTQKNIAVYKLACSLKRRYKLALLTNTNVLHLGYLKKTFFVFDAFHNIIASCELGTSKPQSLIYTKALDILGVSAKEVFYTDDRPQLVQGAKVLGINAFVFAGVNRLKSDLSCAGVKIDAA